MRFESHGAAVRLRYVTNMHNRKTPNKRTRRPKKGIRIRDLYTVNPTTSLLKLGCFWPWRMCTGSGLFSFLSSGFAQIFRQIVFIRLNAIKNTNLEALWQTSVAQERLCLSSPPAPHHKQNLYLYFLWSAEVRDDTIAAQYLSVMRVRRVVFMVTGQKPFHPTSVWIAESRFSVFQQRSIERSSPAQIKERFMFKNNSSFLRSPERTYLASAAWVKFPGEGALQKLVHVQF